MLTTGQDIESVINEGYGEPELEVLEKAVAQSPTLIAILKQNFGYNASNIKAGILLLAAGMQIGRRLGKPQRSIGAASVIEMAGAA